MKTDFEELTGNASLEITGGDDAALAGLIWGLAFSAGLLGAPLEVPLLAAALGAGAVYVLYDSL